MDGESTCNTIDANGSGVTVEATCPAGVPITGGGVDNIDWSAVAPGTNFRSRPKSTGDAWQLRFDDQPGGSGNIVVRARCCTTRDAVVSVGGCPADELPYGIRSADGSGFSLLCAPAAATGGMDCERTEATGDATDVDHVASCNAGKVVTGGGFTDVDANGPPGGQANFRSRPVGDSGWRVRYTDENDTFTVYAQCCEATGSAVTVTPP